MEDSFLYSGGTDYLENFTAEFSASAPMVYANPPPMGPVILYTTGAGEGAKVSVAIFPSSGGGVKKTCLRYKGLARGSCSPWNWVHQNRVSPFASSCSPQGRYHNEFRSGAHSPLFQPQRAQRSKKCNHDRKFSSKPKGPGEQGAAGYCPKILLLKRAKMVVLPFHRSHRQICTWNRPVSETMISAGPFLSRPPPEYFNPGSKISILVWRFQSQRFYLRGPPGVQRWARSKISIHDRALEMFNPEGRDLIFSIPGPSGTAERITVR